MHCARKRTNVIPIYVQIFNFLIMIFTAFGITFQFKTANWQRLIYSRAGTLLYVNKQLFLLQYLGSKLQCLDISVNLYSATFRYTFSLTCFSIATVMLITVMQILLQLVRSYGVSILFIFSSPIPGEPETITVRGILLFFFDQSATCTHITKRTRSHIHKGCVVEYMKS